MNPTIEKLQHHLKNGDTIISSSVFERGFHIKLININPDDSFGFIYCNHEGFPIDRMPRMSVNKITDYKWTILANKIVEKLFNEKSFSPINHYEAKDSDIFESILLQLSNKFSDKTEDEEVKKDKEFVDSLYDVHKNVNKFISEHGLDTLSSIMDNYNKENPKKDKYIKSVGIDFDGTLVTNTYPNLGTVKSNAKETIDALIDSGTQVVIWTCRKPEDINDFLIENGIRYHSINKNTNEMINQWGNDPRKAGVDLFIDDKNIFCKEIIWSDIYKELKTQGYII